MLSVRVWRTSVDRDAPNADRTDGLLLAVGRAHQHQVGEVGTGNQQNEARDPHEQVQPVLVLVPHHLHAVSAVREVQRLLGHQRLVALLDFAQRAEQKLPQLHLHVRFHGLNISAWLNAADQIQPVK